MPVPAVLATLGPGLLAGAGSLLGGAQQNAANRAVAREQMAFQERMSNTAIRRAMEDMRLGGINPMLAGADAASSPMGAAPTMENVVGPAVSSAMHASRLSQELKQMRQEIGLRKRQADADYLLTGAQYEKTVAEKGEVGSRTELNRAMAELNRQGLTGRVLGTDVGGRLSSGLQNAGDNLRAFLKDWVNRVMIDANKARRKK